MIAFNELSGPIEPQFRGAARPIGDLPMSVNAVRADNDIETAAGVPTRDEAIAELRELVCDLRDAAQDGRMLAARYAELLTKCVDEYCVEFEKRAELALQKLEEAIQ
jgi:hypothetical protein